MLLSKIEIHGFKSFAQKISLTFARGMTALVGPNGSGKSNIADALRWVMGEQRLTHLRAKKSDDVIFSGSPIKTRLGYAEVSVFFDNSDGKAPIDFSEIVITRRMYRNGESEYFLNKSKVRLADILLLLAQANAGQKSYGVIGQGMIETILHLSPESRKEFFDEAVGVKPLQIKRDASVHKLQRSLEHLSSAKTVLVEIDPRLRSLTRQMKKLEQRVRIEQSLRSLHIQWYGHQWKSITDHIAREENVMSDLRKELSRCDESHQRICQSLDELGASKGQDNLFSQLEEDHDRLLRDQQRLLNEITVLKGKRQVHMESTGEHALAFLKRQDDEFRNELARLNRLCETTASALSDIDRLLREKQGVEQTLTNEMKKLEIELRPQLERQEQRPTITLNTIKGRLQTLYQSQEQFLKQLLKAKTVDEFQSLQASAKKISIDLAELLDEFITEDEKHGHRIQRLKRQIDMLTLSKMDRVREIQKFLIEQETLKQKKEMIESQRIEITKKQERLQSDLQRLTKPDEENNHARERINRLETMFSETEKRLHEVGEKIHSLHRDEEQKKDELIAFQREERRSQEQINHVQQTLNEHQIVLARLNTKRDDLLQTMSNELSNIDRDDIFNWSSEAPAPTIHDDIQKLKHQLAFIGGIDPETKKEYEETKSRVEFLTRQISDLDGAIHNLNHLIHELDHTIEKQFQSSFSRINRHFQNYFKILFQGGHAKCSLIQTENEKSTTGEENSDEVQPSASMPHELSISGIDIVVSLPDKKIMNLSMLSGGEKSLCAIALLCAIIANNPPPFIVLDEVEASLDEANSERFAKIIKQLDEKTQFILITHNRITIQHASILYGITMGQDGISRILSLHLEDFSNKMIGKHSTKATAAASRIS